MHSLDSDLLGTDPGYGLEWGVPATQSGDALGLVLTGGGARAAYQVGVLRAIAALLQRGAPSPFPIICGTSAGAINAAAVASGASDFAARSDSSPQCGSNFTRIRCTAPMHWA